MGLARPSAHVERCGRGDAGSAAHACSPCRRPRSCPPRTNVGVRGTSVHGPRRAPRSARVRWRVWGRLVPVRPWSDMGGWGCQEAWGAFLWESEP